MQTKYLLTFVAVAVLVGAIVSMTTSGVLAVAQSNNTTIETNGSLIDKILAENGIEDEEDEAEDDEGECNEDDETDSNSASSSNSNEDADEAGNVDANDEEDDDEDENEQDNEEEGGNGATSTSASSNSSAKEDDDEDEEGGEHNMAFDPCNFSSEIHNPYMPLSKYVGKTLTFAGNSTEDGEFVQVEEVWTVLSNTTEVADVQTLTVRIQEYEDGKLVQEALQYYAQGKDGVVYYFGEDVVDVGNGAEIENDDESWTVGDDTAAPGIAMPARPATGIGFGYDYVNVPGIAHEFSEIKGLNESVSVEFGSFYNALVANNYDFNEGKTSQEFYVPGVGLVKEVDDDEEVELISIS